MDNEVGLTHLRLVSDFCVLGGNRVGTCQNENNTNLEERGRKSEEHPPVKLVFPVVCRKIFCPDVFMYFRIERESV